MRQLSDILGEKKARTGHSWAEIGRLLGGLDGQLVGKYANNKSQPSLDFAVKWKQAFNENLIDLMLGEQSIVDEPQSLYETTKDLVDAQKALIKCMEEKAQISKDFEDLKKFGHTGAQQQLAPETK